MNFQKGIGGVVLVVILAVVVVAGGAIFYLSNTNTQPPTEELVDESMTEEDSMMEEESADDEANNTVTINLSGQNFQFSEDTITVRQGQRVTLNFESTQGTHDWVVDEFDAATEQVNPGETTSVTFVADEVGEFEYYCSVGNHRQQGMVGTLTVVE